MYYTYVLKSIKDSRWYTGATRNLRERFKSHNDEKNFSTKSRAPFELLYYEACQNEGDAFAREKFLKSGLGKKYLKARLKRSLSQTGFTLLEVLVVMGIMTMLGGFALIVSMDVYRSFSFRTERDMLISVLQKARSQSMSNMCLGPGCTDGRPHGVHVSTGQYVVFQGATYATRDVSVDEVIAAENGAARIAPSSLTDVVFTQLSGAAAPVGTIGLLDDAGHISTTTINSEGQITWGN